MVKPEVGLKMGQAALCAVSTPTDSLSPLTSGSSLIDTASLPSENGITNDLQEILSYLLENTKDLKVDDILQKFQSIVHENIELKDTIAQNNLALRQQLNLIVQWNQQVENQQRIYRQNNNDLQKKLSNSVQENVLLRSTLGGINNSNDSDSKYQEWHETIQNLNKQLEHENMKLEKALEEKENYMNQRTKLEGEITLLKCDLTASKSESERLHLKLQEYSNAVKDLRQKVMDRDKILTETTNLSKGGNENRMSSALIELQEVRNKNEFLENELKLSKENVTKYKAKYNELSLEETRHATQSPEKRSVDIDRRKLLDEAAMLREEVDTLEAALTEERKKTSEERTAGARMHSENLRIKKDLQEIKNKTERTQNNDQYYQAKIRSIHEHYDEATAKLVSYEELLGSKNDEIARYKKELGQTKAQLVELRSEGETIAVLRAQVEVYQSDFRAEREAREAIAADREKLRDEVRHLQARTSQLVDELEAYQRRQFGQGMSLSPRHVSEERNLGSKEPSSLNPETLWDDNLSSISDKKEELDKKVEGTEVDENLLYCPKCNKTFTELRPLEEHVNRCLDED